jgi:hypothetical protein
MFDGEREANVLLKLDVCSGSVMRELLQQFV